MLNKMLKWRKKNSKGFSLVELIIVIAIMAILVGILAPQFIQYIEKSRASKDEKMVSEVQNAIQVALADETVYAGLADTTITFTAAKQTKIGWDALDTAVQKTISLDNTGLSSKTYTETGALVTITITKSDGSVKASMKPSNASGLTTKTF